MGCKKNHDDIEDFLNIISFDQSGPGRHKCAGCAYNLGFDNGYEKRLFIDLNSILINLNESQRGNQRHRSAQAAYILGYYHGLKKKLDEAIE